MNGKGRKHESLCEKSMLLVANIIKLSTSLSFTKMGHGTHATTAGRRSVAEAAEIPASSPASKRLQEPVSRAKAVYVTEPKYCSYVVHEERDLNEGNVDGWASKYIEKVHKKNKKALEETIQKPCSNLTSRKAAAVLN